MHDARVWTDDSDSVQRQQREEDTKDILNRFEAKLQSPVLEDTPVTF